MRIEEVQLLPLRCRVNCRAAVAIGVGPAVA